MRDKAVKWQMKGREIRIFLELQNFIFGVWLILYIDTL